MISFITNAADVCDAEYVANNIDENALQAFLNENQSSKLTEEEAKEYVNTFLKDVSKNIFVSNCASVAKDYYGETTAPKVCGCAYDHMVTDIPRFTQMLMDNGYPDGTDTSTWGKEYMYECAPEKFTPEMKAKFITNLNEGGLPKSLSTCIVDFIDKEYSVQAFVYAFQNKTINPFFENIISKCQLEMEINSYSNKTSNNYSPHNNGIGDGLAGLLGGGGGGIATKAKGSIKIPSIRDIDMDAGGGPRSAADIMKVVRQRTPGLRHIYNKCLKEKPGFQGKITLKLTIIPNGEISKISIVSSTTGFRVFDTEIKNAVNRWTFSKVQSGNSIVTIPFTFSE